jgi:hypothetical protein
MKAIAFEDVRYPDSLPHAPSFGSLAHFSCMLPRAVSMWSIDTAAPHTLYSEVLLLNLSVVLVPLM